MFIAWHENLRSTVIGCRGDPVSYHQASNHRHKQGGQRETCRSTFHQGFNLTPGEANLLGTPRVRFY